MNLESIVIFLSALFCIIGLLAALILHHWPRDKILKIKELSSSWKHMMPPRHMLTNFGKIADTVFKISSVLMILTLVVGFVLEKSG